MDNFWWTIQRNGLPIVYKIPEVIGNVCVWALTASHLRVFYTEQRRTLHCVQSLMPASYLSRVSTSHAMRNACLFGCYIRPQLLTDQTQLMPDLVSLCLIWWFWAQIILFCIKRELLFFLILSCLYVTILFPPGYSQQIVFRFCS